MRQHVFVLTGPFSNRMDSGASYSSWQEHGGPPVTQPKQKGFGILFDREAILGCNDGNGAVRREQFDKEALVLGVQVLDQHERHAAVGANVGEKRFEGGETSCGSADADNQGWLVPARLGHACVSVTE